MSFVELTVPLVLAWDPRKTVQIAKNFKDAADVLDVQTQQAASRIDMSYTFWEGQSGEAARTRPSRTANTHAGPVKFSKIFNRKYTHKSIIWSAI